MTEFKVGDKVKAVWSSADDTEAAIMDCEIVSTGTPGELWYVRGSDGSLHAINVSCVGFNSFIGLVEPSVG